MLGGFETLRALVKTRSGGGSVALLQVPEPHAGPGQVVMRVVAAALCGTDVHIVHGTLRVDTPRILGHELAGTVAEVGPGVVGFDLGQPITTETDASFCGRCRFCRSGDMHLCAERTGIGTSADGGFAEYVALSAGGVHPLPPGIDIEAGALTEPLAVAVRAVVERGAVGPGERVAVIGPGTIGLLASQVANTRGAQVVLVGLARHARRFRLARDLGVASALVLDDPAGGQSGLDEAVASFDAALDCSGTPAAMAVGLDLLRKGGRLILVGFHGTPAGLDVDRFINRELSLVASRGKRPTSFRLALELLGSGQVDTTRLITHRFPFDDWRDAVAAAGRPGTKVLLRM